MCGIYGMVSRTGTPLRWPDRLPAMGTDLHRRGPDHSGTWTAPSAALGAERLRIVDRRARADQPLRDEHHILVGNGEVYNAPALRAEYADYRFRSQSDLEPILPLLQDSGPAGLWRVRGMFALAAWTPRTRTLVLARDAAGEKPLFWIEAGGELWFASEIAPLLRHPAWTRRVDRTSLGHYLTLGFFPEPQTPFDGIHKVPAGAAMIITPGCIQSIHFGERRWGPAPPANSGRELERSILRAVQRQSVADVPVGVFLSGGLDSALIAAAAARTMPEPVRTFTARFQDPVYDESRHAVRAAAAVGAIHDSIPVTDESLVETHGILAAGLSEPLADPAILPTWILARAASQKVGVVLVGEGADELFGGYPTYLGHRLLERATGWVPWPTVRRCVGRAAASHRRVPLAWLLLRLAEHADEPGAARHLAWTGWGLVSHLTPDERLHLAARLVPTPERWSARSAMDTDFRLTLRDSLLVKLDRATMWFGLEARAPFLDPDVVALARSLEPNQTATAFRSKVALKAMAKTLVPPSIVHRRKRGLSVPIARLLNGPLREPLDRQFRGCGLDRFADLVPSARPRQLLKEHRAGDRNHARALWTVFTLLTWLDHWGVD